MAIMINILTYFKTAPNFEIWHSHPGQVSEVIITAGMHGDELSSIEAARSLISTYHGNIPITVVPILNLEGFKQGTSYNPLDSKDPIYLYPGVSYGSSSSKLMYKISKLTKGKKLWIDLHGGAKDEYLKPFIWASTSHPALSHLSGRTLVEPTYAKDLPYFIFEAGELGQIDPKSVALQLSWIQQVLENMGKTGKPNWRPTYTSLIYDKNIGQDKNAENFLWSSPTHYISGLYDDISR